MTARAVPSQATATAVCPAASAAARAATSSAGSSMSVLGQQLRPADQHRVRDHRLSRSTSATTPRTPSPGSAVELGHAGQRRRRPRRRAAAATPGRSGARRPAPSRRPGAAPGRASTPAAGCTPCTVITPVVTVPGLVQHHRVHPAGGLQHLRALDQDARAGRRGRSPTSSAVGVARPSAHGQAMISTATAALTASSDAAPAPEPEPERRHRQPDHDRDEHPGDPVGQPLRRGLAALRARRPAGPSGPAGCPSPPGWRAPPADPPTLTQPPVTGVPGPNLDRAASPVISAVSTAELPSATTPSAAIRSPGRTTNRVAHAQLRGSGPGPRRRHAAPRRPWRPGRAARAAPRRPGAWTGPRRTGRPG